MTARDSESFYSQEELLAARTAVRNSLMEDLGDRGDITSSLLVEVVGGAEITAEVIPRESGVLAGRQAATEAFYQVSEAARVEWKISDGNPLVPGVAVGCVTGSAEHILKAERTALNFLTHLSGVATATRDFVARVASVSPECRIRDTRKTLPGLRLLEKAAVRAGGGLNHRMGLGDAILIKDNHLAAFDLTSERSSSECTLVLRRVIELARDRYPGITIEIEADDLRGVELAVNSGADTVLCDNMTPAELKEAVAIVQHRCKVEASGGVTLDNVEEVAATGVDFIAVGAITHSARALDIGLDVTK